LEEVRREIDFKEGGDPRDELIDAAADDAAEEDGRTTFPSKCNSIGMLNCNINCLADCFVLGIFFTFREDDAAEELLLLDFREDAAAEELLLLELNDPQIEE
jgi:hypothetical protein